MGKCDVPIRVEAAFEKIGLVLEVSLDVVDRPSVPVGLAVVPRSEQLFAFVGKRRDLARET